MEGQSNKSLNKNMSRAAPMDSMQQPCILKALLLWMQQFAITFKVSFNNLILEFFFSFTANMEYTWTYTTLYYSLHILYLTHNYFDQVSQTPINTQ